MSNFIKLSALIAIVTLLAVLNQADATDYPAPPKVPVKFNTPEEVQQYLGKLHNYYVMVGRPRFGKRAKLFDTLMSQEQDEHLELFNELQRKISELYNQDK